jgi:recombination protein RecA
MATKKKGKASDLDALLPSGGSIPAAPSIAESEGMAKVRALLAKRLGVADVSKVLQPISKNTSAHIERVSSGDLGLDLALGGGFPRGLAVKLQGKFSVGKSIVLAQHMRVVTSILQRPICLIDVEGTWTDAWLRAQGIPTDMVFLQPCGSAEEALDAYVIAYSSGEFEAVYLDSIAQLSPDTEFDEGMAKWQQGLLAREVGKWTRSVNRANAEFRKLGKIPPSVFFTNQIRTNTAARFNKDITPGGTQQDNFATIIVDLRHIGTEHDITEGSDNDEIVKGRGVLATIIKNKTAPPLRKTMLKYLIEPYAGHPAYSYFHGDTALVFGLRLGIIEKSGSWYALADGTKLGQGAKNAVQFMAEQGIIPLIVEKVRERVSSSMRLAYIFRPLWENVIPLADGDTLAYVDRLRAKGLDAAVGEAFIERDSEVTEVHPSQYTEYTENEAAEKS